MKLRLAAFALASAGSVLVAACATETAAPSNAAMVQQGQALVSSNCAECHAIGAQGASPNADAPPLRTVFDRTNQSRIARSFHAGVMVGDNETDMPVFKFTSEETDAILAYLRDIKE